jgi:pimeloyl-ACP methyl ester carboxylesterase
MTLSEAMIKNAPLGWAKPSAEQRQMMKEMDKGQDPVALGAGTVSHQGLWVTDDQLKAITIPTLVLYGRETGRLSIKRPRHDCRTYGSRSFQELVIVGLSKAPSSPETFVCSSTNT